MHTGWELINSNRTNLVKGLSTQAFESGGVPHDHIHCPLGKEELMQAVVGDLRNKQHGD